MSNDNGHGEAIRRRDVGSNEKRWGVRPRTRLVRLRDGTSGTAFFTFENPDVFEGAQGDITGMYMADEEGEMTTVRVVVFTIVSVASHHISSQTTRVFGDVGFLDSIARRVSIIIIEH